MDINMIMLYLGITAFVVAAGYRIYTKYYLDDGKITLDEIGDIIEDIADVAEEVSDMKK